MHVLVTGGAGFIGSHLVKHHLAKGDQVHVVDNLSTGSLDNVMPFISHDLFRFHKYDVATWRGWSYAIKWADLVYHFAAVVGVRKVIDEPLLVFSTNIDGSVKLFRTISITGAKPRIVIASSSSVYGPDNKAILQEDNPVIVEPGNSLSSYMVSKLANESMATAYYQNLNIPITIARLFNTIGPGQSEKYGMVVPSFVKQACNNKPITIYGDGKQTRCFNHVSDTVNAITRLANEKKSYGETINVGSEREISINELANLIKKRSNSKSPIEHVSYKEAYGQKFNDYKRRRPDLSKLKKLIQYKPQISLEECIDELIQIEREK